MRQQLRLAGLNARSLSIMYRLSLIRGLIGDRGVYS